MKAIAIAPGEADVRLFDIPEPEILSPTQIKILSLEVGICGTDREGITGGRSDAPKGHHHLVIGHEMFGHLVDTGAEVATVAIRDDAVLPVRRECGKMYAVEESCAFHQHY